MEFTLQAEPRTGTGKGVARKLRAQGRIPAILYGRGIDPVALSVDHREIMHALHTDAGRNVLIDLRVNGENHLTLARDIQKDAVRGNFLHVDFIKIAHDVAIEVDVTIHTVGDSAGVRAGGVVEHHIWSVAVRCLPTNVPEAFEADITEIEMGQSLRVGQLAIPEGVEVLTSPDEVVLSVVEPQKPEEVVPEPVEGEEAAAAVAATPEGGAEAGAGTEGS